MDRTLSYQLVLKSKVNTPINLHYLALRGPHGDMKVNPQIYEMEFSSDNSESPYHNLPLCDPAETNRVLSAKTINLRLIMFQIPK